MILQGIICPIIGRPHVNNKTYLHVYGLHRRTPVGYFCCGDPEHHHINWQMKTDLVQVCFPEEDKAWF